MERRMTDNLKGDNIENSKKPDPNYWRTFEELYGDKDFIKQNENEFRTPATGYGEPSNMSMVSRRKFLALLGASAAFAGVSCSDYRDKGEIIPYNKKPEEITVGQPNYYASTCNSCSNACGTLIKTREGRPIKIDGNPYHPVSKGKLCAQGQASIMNLYDPDRLKNPLKNDGSIFIDYNWNDANDEIILDLMSVGEQEIAIVTGKIVSPTTKKVLTDFKQKYASTIIYSYELFNSSVKNAAWKKCYGSGEFPAIKWNEADVVISLDGDFLGESNNKVENVRLFAENRDVTEKRFNRLYSVEGNLSLTGTNADCRFKLRPDLQYTFVMSLINELQKKGTINLPVNTSGYSLSELAEKENLDLRLLGQMVNDLNKNKGRSIIYAGEHLNQEVQIAVNLLNDALGNTGLYQSDSANISILPLSTNDKLKQLTSNLKAGNVGVVIHLNSNPVYHFPEDIGYQSALEYAGTVVTLVDIENETSAVSNFVLPINQTLEAWGDAKTRSGFYSLQQPVIAPLYDTREQEAILLTWIEQDNEVYTEKLYHHYLMQNWEENIYPTLNSNPGFKKFWFQALHDGIVYSGEKNDVSGTINMSVVSQLNGAPKVSGYALHLKESYQVRDGRFANNGWLQELPHPVSKVTWDNYAAISPAAAKELGFENGDISEITVGSQSLQIPVFIQPGASENTITIELGYGRTNGGTVGTNVGFNANILLNTGGLSQWLYTGADIKKVSGNYKLVTAQTIYAFDQGNKVDLPKKRGIIKEGTVEEYLKNSHFISEGEHHEMESVNPQIEYPGLKWGMSIDLNKCLGCNDCVVACNVENNVPVVGKEQVEKGREMHWLRIDRYYSGTADDPVVVNQPMLCQHCDQAPCENVCPVVATNHSPDGLNQMVYNRCVGTRYCSNNCPYKVRRFNFYNFRDHFRDGYQEEPVFALLQNPEVTVRSRGVMEKCTFCIQRISEARSDATAEGREIKGSDVTTACQDACGTNAIKFGDINDEQSEFYNYRNHELGYYVLEELNIKPNVTYLAKLRNTPPEEAW
jgi:MoCo/4Fe-4S cofactor protein with predicted Tat translocation signal